MVELTEEQEAYLAEWIDREFLCRASSLFGLIYSLRAEDKSLHVSTMMEINEAIGNVHCTPELRAFIEREENLEELNHELEELEDSEEAYTEDGIEAINDLQYQIESLRDDDEFRDKNPPGEIHNVWIITNHAGTCPHWKTIMNSYPGSVVPIIEVEDVYFWVNTEYNIMQCDWLRLLVREYLCAGS